MDRCDIHAIQSSSSRLKVKFLIFWGITLSEVYKTQKESGGAKEILKLFKSHIIHSLQLSLKISVRRVTAFNSMGIQNANVRSLMAWFLKSMKNEFSRKIQSRKSEYYLN